MRFVPSFLVVEKKGRSRKDVVRLVKMSSFCLFLSVTSKCLLFVFLLSSFCPSRQNCLLSLLIVIGHSEIDALSGGFSLDSFFSGRNGPRHLTRIPFCSSLNAVYSNVSFYNLWKNFGSGIGRQTATCVNLSILASSFNSLRAFLSFFIHT